MWSKTWAIALALISRLTVTDCIGPPLIRPYSSAAGDRIRDPDVEIDAAYRMKEELGRQNTRGYLENKGNSATEVDYADDVAEPRHRYYGNKYQPRSHVVTEEKPPDMTSIHRQGFQQSSFHGPTRVNHHQPRHEEVLRGHQQRSKVDGYEPAVENYLKEPAAGAIKTGPFVQIRSGIESFQPIAAAIAMQENLNALDEVSPDASPPPPHRPPGYPQPSDHEPEIQGQQPPRPQVPNKPIDSDSSENEILRPEFDHENPPAPKGVQAALQRSEVIEDSETGSLTEVYFLAVIAGCSVAGFMGLVISGVCYYRLRKKVKAASDVEYPAYGVTGPNKEREVGGPPGDRKLAQSAQMYHYQHQKQQMIASERLNSDVNHRGGSDAESEDENEEGDYTVFECPGLATNGEMEVRNPLFNEQTPVAAPLDVPAAPSKK